MEQVRRSNTVIYGEHYISTIKLRTMRCITTTNKFSGIRFCFGIFVSRNKGFILNYLNRTCTSYILVFLGVTLCLYFFCVFVSKLNITPYNRLSGQQMLSGTYLRHTEWQVGISLTFFFHFICFLDFKFKSTNEKFAYQIWQYRF